MRDAVAAEPGRTAEIVAKGETAGQASQDDAGEPAEDED